MSGRAQDILDILDECRIVYPNVQARFVINRLFVGTKLGAEVNEVLAGLPIPVLQTTIRNRTEYAKAVREGKTALETEPNSPAAKDGFHGPDLVDTLEFGRKESTMGRNQYSYPPEYRVRMVELVRAGRQPVLYSRLAPIQQGGHCHG